MVPRVNVVENTMTFRLRDFVRMDPPIFFVSKVGEYTEDFLDGVYKVLSSMGVTTKKKTELASYKLRDDCQICYTEWKDNRSEESGPNVWEEFKEAFLGMYFPCEKREVKVE